MTIVCSKCSDCDVAVAACASFSMHAVSVFLVCLSACVRGVVLGHLSWRFERESNSGKNRKRNSAINETKRNKALQALGSYPIRLV